ncbi:hypothetical protein Cni_G22389 [Canna indica]|uniref:Uncharacterized protein n=1 Tax=Canna indica TaxID=4628 RepID=A0AAQ3QL55_9LILI|nr:hypothetical protein Cni_G22389 [Canna indica]
MKPESSWSSREPNLWQTPTPYLFGGFSAVVILIAVALIVLFCSHRKLSVNGGSSELMSLPEVAIVVPLEMEPRFVVVMPGENMPSFVARPFNLEHSAEGSITSAAMTI